MNRHAITIWLSLAAIVGLTGCEPGAEFANNPTAQNTSKSGQLVSTRSPATRLQGLPVRTPQTILISSFNIQTFGKKKLEDPWVIEKIVAIIRQFDVVAVQEVRAEDQTTIPRLIKLINSNGANYDYLLGPRLGRTASKEQYAFIYDTASVVSSPDAIYTIEDNADLLHREPLVARFVTRVPQGIRPFSFSLVNIHTDPDEVKTELPVMHTVLKGIREFEYLSAHEDDVILLGDLNAGPKQFGPLAQIPGIYWIIDSEATNTIRKSIYDNMIFDRGLTNEYTGRSGVLDVCDMFGIKVDEALRISDHLPIWAEFTTQEQLPGSSTAQIVERNNPAPRR
ncbi:MAG: endonuclease/exonuclease/phosphatase [Planctomycetota bacterium]|nr:endonuclease/exonuclease/phosphatase [Planctomycetota bacterium]